MWSLSIVAATSTWTKQTVPSSPSPRYSTVYGTMNELLLVSHGGCLEEGKEGEIGEREREREREGEGEEGRGGEIEIMWHISL